MKKDGRHDSNVGIKINMYSNGANEHQGHPDITHSGQGTPSMVVLPKMDDLNLLRQLKLRDILPKKQKKLTWFFKNIQIIKGKSWGGAAGSPLVRINQWLGCGAFLRVCVLVAQLRPTLYSSMNCSPPGSPVHGISQAGILEWVAISFSRGIFLTQGLNPHLLGLLCWQAESLPSEPPRKWPGLSQLREL